MNTEHQTLRKWEESSQNELTYSFLAKKGEKKRGFGEMPFGMALQSQATHHEVFSCAGQPSWARWACPACGTWRCTSAPARPARRWNCSSYPSASSRSDCEPPCTHKDKHRAGEHEAHETVPRSNLLRISKLPSCPCERDSRHSSDIWC